MIRKRLPGNWSSTGNALEDLAFILKDVLLVVDDFCPTGAKHDHDRMHQTADRLFRAQGNGSGRQRMRSDCSQRPEKPPRGLILATGEDVPRGHSLAARLSIREVKRGDVNLNRLSDCQGDAVRGDYASAMSGFLQWLAPRYGQILKGIGLEQAELRKHFVGRYPHARTPDVVANQLIGLRFALRFAADVGAINEKQRDDLWRRGQTAIRKIGEQQGEHQRAANPVERFQEMLAGVISSGRGHVADEKGDEPRDWKIWGWEAREFRSGQNETGVNYVGRGQKIGWVNEQDSELYLNPDSTYAAIVKLTTEQGQPYPLTQQTLFRRLKDAKLLLRTEGDRAAYPETIEGRRQRVLVFSTSLLLQEPVQPVHPGRSVEKVDEFIAFSCPDFENPLGNSGQDAGKVGTESGDAGKSVPTLPTPRTDIPGRPEKPGQENRPNSSEKTQSVPAVPFVPVF